MAKTIRQATLLVPTPDGRELRVWGLRVEPGRIPSVQVLRAIAALSVVFGHASYESRDFDRGQRYLSFLHGEYWQAGVDLFFIISGFIMMWSFSNRFGEPGASRKFLLRRSARIFPSYWAFTLAMICATLLLKDRVESAIFTPDHAILSLLLVPHIAPHGGIHPILSLGWTLIYEAFFYLCFALCLLLPRRSGLIALVAIFLVVFCAARSTLLLPEALKLFWGDSVMFEFLLGVAFYFVQRDGRLSRSRLFAVLATSLLIGAAAWMADAWSANRLWHYGLPALALFSVVFAGLARVKTGSLLLLVLMGEASYTLYLSHPFILEIVKGAFEFAHPSAAVAVAYVAVGVSAAAIFSVCTYGVLEQRFSRWLLERTRSLDAVKP